MRGLKYRFNPKTLTFEKVERKLSKSVFYVFGSVVVAIFLAIGITSVVVSYFDTPEMKSLRKENVLLLTQYKTLNTKLSQIENVLDELQVRDDNIYRVIFSSNPIPGSVRKAGFGGIDKYSEMASFNNNKIVLNTSKKIDILSKQAYIQAKSYEEVLDLALRKEKELASTPAIIPVSEKNLSKAASGWGMRIHPIYKVPRFHYGMDFVAPVGTKVYATGSGKVVVADNLNSGFGKHIVISHGFGFETLYGHLSKYNVKPGQDVKRGELIGYIGNTGISSAPHLHYEVHKNGKEVNPKFYYFKDLSPDEFDQLVSLSPHVNNSFD